MTHDQKTMAKQAFLESFRVIGVVSRAAVNAGVSRRSVYNWLTNDHVFQESFKDAEEDSRDLIRDEIRRRAIIGWQESVYQRGELVGQITKYSDALLIRMARARLPEYRDAEKIAKPAERAEGMQTKVIVEIREAADWRAVQRVKN